jgi:integral membrane protein
VVKKVQNDQYSGRNILSLAFVYRHAIEIHDGLPLAVTYVGWAHGILFVLYIYVVFPTARRMSWNFSKTFFALMASVLPFGPFIFDRYMTKEEKEMASS